MPEVGTSRGDDGREAIQRPDVGQRAAEVLRCWEVLRLLLVVLLAAVPCGLLFACGDASNEPEPGPMAVSDAGVQHIHGVAINPADQSLMIATHTGLFRAAAGRSRAERVGDLYQDTMGFTAVGPDEFLGSGHPDARTDLPPLLGLIRSNDGGRSWTPVSLLGRADFHILRAAGPRIFGYDTAHDRLMVSHDGGRTWHQRRPPAPLVDLAADPADPDRLLASSEAGIAQSRDAGQSWRLLSERRTGVMAWTPDGIALIDGDGRVHRSTDGGSTWETAGVVGGQPAAMSAYKDTLVVALHTNAVKVSTDDGQTWSTRLRP